MGCRCDNITISPPLLAELDASHDPLPRKLWPSMGGQGQPRIDMTAPHFDTFKKMHGEVRVAVRSGLLQGITGQLCADAAAHHGVQPCTSWKALPAATCRPLHAARQPASCVLTVSAWMWCRTKWLWTSSRRALTRLQQTQRSWKCS